MTFTLGKEMAHCRASNCDIMKMPNREKGVPKHWKKPEMQYFSWEEKIKNGKDNSVSFIPVPKKKKKYKDK